MKHIKKFENFEEKLPKKIQEPGYGTPCPDCNCCVEQCNCGCKLCNSKKKEGKLFKKMNRTNDYTKNA